VYDISKYPVGTIFNVLNGGWKGVVIEEIDGKRIRTTKGDIPIHDYKGDLGLNIEIVRWGYGREIETYRQALDVLKPRSECYDACVDGPEDIAYKLLVKAIERLEELEK